MFLEIFQKPPSRQSISARWLTSVCWLWVLEIELPGGTRRSAKQRLLFNPILGFLMKGLVVVTKPPGDTSPVGFILMFSGFWVVLIEGKGVQTMNW